MFGSKKRIKNLESNYRDLNRRFIAQREENVAQREENRRLNAILRNFLRFGEGASALVRNLTGMDLDDKGTDTARGHLIFGSGAVTVFINPGSETITVADPNGNIQPVEVTMLGGGVTMQDQMLIFAAAHRIAEANKPNGSDPLDQSVNSVYGLKVKPAPKVTDDATSADTDPEDTGEYAVIIVNDPEVTDDATSADTDPEDPEDSPA